MPAPIRHSWNLAPAQAIALQGKLAARVSIRPLPSGIRWIAGLDAAFSEDECVAAVVLWDTRRKEVVEQRIARAPLRFPYIPGLLSFREAPALLAALEKLERRPDVLMCDGQGLAHPRRFGIACHIGVLAEIPSVGCAKSLLVGEFREPAKRRGSRAALADRGERIGTVLCTRDGVRPVIVSVGHLANLATAEKLVLRCAVSYRLPEPTRLADQLCGATAHLV
ncbi:MAG TPA: deoxyribonuclease V [Kiritimatiellia bacterium]|nr:deoxyribonuclease V [Kiritimatiellia bacterium]HRZ12616.1 deoxyribonuclease V [Kiritimatiellia bacterium]HSA17694.1 deoxyribonuclease V [Kiritimatiellia bacterium]